MTCSASGGTPSTADAGAGKAKASAKATAAKFGVRGVMEVSRVVPSGVDGNLL